MAQKKRMLKKKTIIFLIIIFSIMVTSTSLILDLILYADKPAGTDIREKIITIRKGQNIKQISEELYGIGVITSRFKFELLSRLKGLDTKLKTGDYTVSPSMSPTKILYKFTSGKIIRCRITIPEGYTLAQVSALIMKSNLKNCHQFYEVASDPTLTRQLRIDADTFEGYLFPDTYIFSRGVTPQEVIQKMLNRFRSVFTDEWKNQAKKLGFSVHQVVTLASIIEKETGAPSERPIISSVFHNRLKEGMRLQSDPTVIYSIENFDGDLTREHLKQPTPYNTYKIKGLPPGPIANPGKKALEAALFPADTPYFYFVSKGDRTHHFSTTLEEHNQAVATYQLLNKIITNEAN